MKGADLAKGIFVLTALAMLAACGPVPVAQAEQECLASARLAHAPGGSIWVGINSEGQTGGGIELTITSDYLTGRDPSEVFNSCVMRRSGQFPSRPLTDQPERGGIDLTPDELLPH